MTKEEAHDILRDWLDERSDYGKDLPIFDEVVIQYFDVNCIRQYTFRGLLKIAYDLKDINETT